MIFNPYLWIWIVLAVVVLAMAIYRHALVKHEDQTLDVLESSEIAAEQMKVFKKAETIEHWGKLLTVAVVVYGLGLGAVYLYQAWQQSGQIR